MANAIRVMSGLAVRGALEQVVLPAFAKDPGIPVDVRWDPTTVIMRALAADEPADLVIVTDEAVRTLEQQGRIDSRHKAKLGRAVLGAAVRAGAAKPDIATTAAFRQALLDARSVIYSRAGASGIYFEKLIEKLGIAEPIRARATVIPAGLTAERLVTGEGDLAIQQISELLMIDGVDIAGPFPPELQSATGFTAAILNGAPRAAEAAELMQALTSSAARDAYKASGLELP